MSEINLKFNAKNVDQIERKHGVSIEQLLGDTSVQRLAYFIEKAQYDEDREKIGVHNEQSYELLDAYLAEHDKEDLIMDIMEALQKGGFLSRKVDISKMREALEKKTTEVSEVLDKALNDKTKTPKD